MRRKSTGPFPSFGRLYALIVVFLLLPAAPALCGIEEEIEACLSTCDIECLESLWQSIPDLTLKESAYRRAVNCAEERISQACEAGDAETLGAWALEVSGESFFKEPDKSRLNTTIQQCAKQLIAESLDQLEREGDMERLRFVYFLAFYYSQFEEEPDGPWHTLLKRVSETQIRTLKRLMARAAEECDLERLKRLFMYSIDELFPGEAGVDFQGIVEKYLYECVRKLLKEAALRCDFEAMEEAASYALDIFFPGEHTEEVLNLFFQLVEECISKISKELQENLNDPKWYERFLELLRVLLSGYMPEGDTRWYEAVQLFGQYLAERGCAAELIQAFLNRMEELFSHRGEISREELEEAVLSAVTEANAGCGVFRRADSNADCTLDIADAVFTLNYLFAGGTEPSCLDSADANDDGAVDIGDAVTVLAYLFNAGSVLPEPFGEPGLDPTEDALSCLSYPACAD